MGAILGKLYWEQPLPCSLVPVQQEESSIQEKEVKSILRFFIFLSFFLNMLDAQRMLKHGLLLPLRPCVLGSPGSTGTYRHSRSATPPPQAGGWCSRGSVDARGQGGAATTGHEAGEQSHRVGTSRR